MTFNYFLEALKRETDFISVEQIGYVTNRIVFVYVWEREKRLTCRFDGDNLVAEWAREPRCNQSTFIISEM